jgi:hypothetical protein
MVKGEGPKLEAEEIKAALGQNRCPVCQIEIDTALAEGCPFLADKKAWAQ